MYTRIIDGPGWATFNAGRDADGDYCDLQRIDVPDDAAELPVGADKPYASDRHAQYAVAEQWLAMRTMLARLHAFGDCPIRGEVEALLIKVGAGGKK